MTPTTPSPIADQAVAQEAFELAWHRYDIYPTQYRDDGEINAYSDPVKEKAWRVFRYCSTAPTTVSASEIIDCGECACPPGICDKEVAVNAQAIPATGSVPIAWITKAELAKLIDMTADAWVYWAEWGHVAETDEIPLYDHPASHTASVLSEDEILAIAIDHGLGTAVVESIAKALLAASMGGEKA